MVTSYILILTLSAWISAAALSLIAKRMAKLLGTPLAELTSMMAMLVALAFLVVASAPGWTIVVALALIALPPLGRNQRLPVALPWICLLGILILLALTPLLGAPSWIALDSALIAASIWGATQIRGVTPMGRAWVPYAWLAAWLGYSAAATVLMGASHAS